MPPVGLLDRSVMAPPLPRLRTRLQRNLYARLNWWLEHFIDRPFPEWATHAHEARPVTLKEFAKASVDRGVRFRPGEHRYSTELLYVGRTIWIWLRGAEPSLYHVHALCSAWDVPVDNWLLADA